MTSAAIAFDDAQELSRAKAIFSKQAAHRWTAAQTTAAEREKRLKRLRSGIFERRGSLAEAIHADFRKHPAETELTEFHPTIVELNHTLSHLKRWMRPRPVGTPLLLAGARSEVRYEPRGQVLIIAPWNYPFYLTIDPLIAAIAAGNVVMLRPSEKTPHTGRFIQLLLKELFPEEEVACVLGGIELSASLLELPFDHFFFTGSPAVGQKVAQAAARHQASCTLELGGKSPAIVDASARLDNAAERLVWGKLINAGQTCVAPDYVLAHRSIADGLVERIKARIEESYGATSAERKASDDLCRLVDGAAFARVKGLLDASVAEGAKVAFGGDSDESQRYLEPTVLTGVTPAMPIMKQEIFGPVLPILTYDQLPEALAQIRAGTKPLATYFFSENETQLERMLAETTAGGACVNTVVLHLTNPELPFGGVGASGQGSYHGEFGFRTFSHERATLVQERAGVAKLFAPPYREQLRKIAALATKYIA